MGFCGYLQGLCINVAVLLRNMKENKGGKATLVKNHIAGLCFPLCDPSGCLKQELPVKLEILERLVPQYLHSYFAFSLPS